jgi:hypothetical protein
MSLLSLSKQVLRTLCYSLDVQGFSAIPTKAFPIRGGFALREAPSSYYPADMFRLSLTRAELQDQFEEGVSLEEFHFAFLTSPLFALELWLLSDVFGIVDRTTTSSLHLREVASGEKKQFAQWSTVGREGNPDVPVSVVSSRSSKQNSADVIMRVGVRQSTFCDTWWAVDLPISNRDHKQDEAAADLVFGTILEEKMTGLSGVTLRLFDPVHRLYSRLLLASAKTRLLELRRQEIGSGQNGQLRQHKSNVPQK